ncbi:hypothetical protein N7540_000153 [Penicillium herquei]|nr:hypothetical protein N7540_000153 [Penicillium herquei]
MANRMLLPVQRNHLVAAIASQFSSVFEDLSAPRIKERQTGLEMPPLLSNSAAEFTETRAGPFFLERFPSQLDIEERRPQFVTGLDCFTCAGEAPK